MSTDQDLGFDPAALRDRYREERDKRLREDALDQYVKIDDVFPHFLDDPYVEPATRAARAEDVEVLVIGGGFGGLVTGARLRQAGIKDICIIEKGGDFGGTWYWNRYPGAACDVESYVYLPLLEETGTVPTRKYANAPEILEHCRAIARKFDLYDRAIFQTAVTGLRWDEQGGRWNVTTDRGDVLRARFVAMANGPLNIPKLPGIPGIETFKGHSFHTSRWDYRYTGGTSDGKLDGLAGKVVGIIGTGATAVQCIPHLAKGAEHLNVFQRTPSSIDVRDDRPTDRDWIDSLEPGWQAKRVVNFTTLTSGGSAEEDMVKDGWTDIIGNIQLLAQKKRARGEPVDDIGTLMQMADFQKMEQIRARVDNVIKDPATAEALKPYYNQFCKRPCFHDDYLPTFNRENVTLVDTQGQGVERITANGAVVAGKEHKLDCLIYATGFEVGISFERRVGYPIFGRDGVALNEKWKTGASTLHGLMSHGYPNCFMISPVQSAVSVNFVHVIDAVATQIAYIIGRTVAAGGACVEVTESAESAWVDEIMRRAVDREAFLKECTPGYYNHEGNRSRFVVRNAQYGAGPVAFMKLLETWRDGGAMDGLVVSQA